jgi:NAD(P)-dependent dehydrogenase (short-subunit alcohol dehydrogenase family)
MAHISPLSAPRFVATKSAKEIAERLREDEGLVDAGKPCSWVAWSLPQYSTGKGEAIAACLAPIPHLSHDINRLIFENLAKKIRRYLNGEDSSQALNGRVPTYQPSHEQLPPSELSTTLKVLAHLQEKTIIHEDTPAKLIISWLEQVTPRSPSYTSSVESTSPIPEPPPIPRKRLCYICRLVITNAYPSHPSLCMPCGTFNSSASLISKPPKLLLQPNFVALVTGARINLGYHTALRLLRCGARVIATSRYPRDAVARYLKEQDSQEWQQRLKVIGADFRSAADAFALASDTKMCLKAWGSEELRLGAIINNAAQTLTDSVKKEERAIEMEDKLHREIEGHEVLIEGTYRARVRGGMLPMSLESTKSGAMLADGSNGATATNDTISASGATTAEVEPYTKSSWVQSLFEIPYEDVMSAHAVNTFVPLILIRELLPLMGRTKSEASPPSTKPHAYIVNVSSREGIFEERTGSNAKGGKHVHTNMSKAALNMITETEAATAWKSQRVAMNTVDPGYMSAAPEYEDSFDGLRPIGWEDGAGRVLWPIAVGEIEGKAIWGRFLKHYGTVEVEPGAGRG